MTEDSTPLFQLLPLLDAATESALRASIERFGVLVPIHVDQHGRTLDGHHRRRLADELGVPYRVDVVQVADDDEAREIARTLNLDRRQISPEQRRELVAVLRQEGHSQRAIAGAVGVSQKQVRNDLAQLSTSTQFTEPERTKGLDNKWRPAKRPTVVTAKNEKEAKQAQNLLSTRPDLTDSNVVTLHEARKEARQQDKAERVASIASSEPPPVSDMGPFDVLYVDPPWRYEHAEPTRAIENNYPTMSLDEIKALAAPAAASSVLFMWATSPKLAEALEVVSAWGFDYRTSMVWVKDRLGMGYYARQRHEILLICKRGDFPVPDPENRPDSVIAAPRGVHSEKPDVVYELIERMYPRATKAELFARRRREGWAAWGNQAEGAA